MADQTDGTYRVVAAIADKQKVVLYLEDGETVTVSQGDVRLNALMDEIIPITARGEVAVVNLKKFSVFSDFERQTNGIVRFYKVKRQALGSLTGAPGPGGQVVVVNMEFTPDISPVEMMDLIDQAMEHTRPWWQQEYSSPLVPAKPVPDSTPILAAVDMEVNGKPETVVERLEPVTPEKSEYDLKDDEIIVAVIGDTLIPDVDKLRPYILHAVKTNSTQAVENFLKRVAKVIKDRSHSVLDLMRFLEKADLPLADDGSIVAYKVLNRKDGHFVDCHTGKVSQKVGSFVCVAEELVDKNRHNECSNGLHIARRGYLRSFHGNVCTICKIAPEDVIVVPHDDPNKVRVSGYHILSVLDDQAFASVKSDKPMTNGTNAQMQLLDAISGNHVQRLEEVRIHGQAGEDVRVTSLVQNRKKPAKTTVAAPAELKKATALDDPTVSTSIEPREMNKRVNAEIEQNQKKKPAPKKPAKTAPKAKAVKEQKPAAAPKKSETTPNGGLSAEQKRALDLLGTGVSQSEVARQTGISRRTLGRLVEKYGTGT